MIKEFNFIEFLIKMLIFQYLQNHQTEDNDLEKLIECNKYEFLKYLINKNDILNHNDILLLACIHGHLDMVKYLINQGVDIYFEHEDIDADGADKMNILLIASYKGHLHIVTYLIRNQNMDPHMQYNAPLVWACAYGRLNVVKYLIEEEQTEDLDIHIDNDNLIVQACISGNLELVKYLIDKGLDIHINNDSVLCEATKNLEFFKYLVEEHNFDPRMQDDKPFSIACTYLDSSDVIKYLIELGADINMNDGQALREASHYNNFELVKFLVEECNANIDPNMSKYKYKYISLSFINENDEVSEFFKSMELKNLEIIKYLESKI